MIHGHVADRLKERSPKSEPEVASIIQKIRRANLAKGETYHVPLPKQRGFVIVGDVGKKKPRHVVKTVLSPTMRPPGKLLRMRELKTASVYDLLGIPSP